MRKALLALLACTGMVCAASAYQISWTWNLPDMFYTDTDWSDTYDVQVILTLVHGGTESVISDVTSVGGTATHEVLVDYQGEAAVGDQLYYTIITTDGLWKYTGQMFTWPANSGVTDQTWQTPFNNSGIASISDANGDGILLPPGEANGWVAVPEPTSLALLALGVAAMGLRRKVK